MISKVSNWYLDVKISNDYLKEHFNLITLKGFGIENQNLLIKSAALALDYVNKNYCGKVNHIINYKKINDSDVMILDGYTVKNLEIFKSISSGNNSGTLISSIDKTKTSAGSRLLKKIISRPLTDINKINKRLDRIEELNKNLETRDFIIGKLEESSDLERLISKISANKANPRDIISLSSSLEILDLISDYILKNNLRKNSDLVKSRFDLKDIILNISKSVISDPRKLTKGSFIKDGVDSELDEYRKLSKNAKDWLVSYQQKIKDETGISKLKVGYNRVFGYYIEVTNTHLDKIPDYFIRKQTLTNAERFFTEELKEYEDKILSAEENIIKIELDIFNSLRDSVLLNIQSILANSKILAQLDISTSFSKLAEDKKYIRPILSNDKKIEIKGIKASCD